MEQLYLIPEDRLTGYKTHSQDDKEFRALVRANEEKNRLEGCSECKIPPGWYNHIHCPECGSTKHEVRNHDVMWGDGDVHCVRCGSYIRMWDSG